jgi:asparagine synthase (glutamine-hydrolysing)
MCGLAGVWEVGAPVSRELLLEMAAELVHRGPDGVGLYLDDDFGMTSTRLAIVDLENGDQPISSEDGRYWVIQNGEIYNYIELRQELERLGHTFSTQSDTEVLVHAYETWGADCLTRLNGDFAFVVWDSVRRQLFAARDRFGVRPLFLLERGHTLGFASEAKALLRHPRASRELDPAALLETFTTWAISPDRSAFRGIRELPPAHYLIADADGGRVERRWWDLDFSTAEAGSTIHDAAEQLRELLDDATRIRLRADVVVAAYLSGGLDSSMTVALARRHVDSLVSFGLGFEEATFDESSFQEEVARTLETSLERVVVTDADIGALLPRAIGLAERPTLRTALVPLLVLSGHVHSAGIKVVLTGEGADELFAGYDIFLEDKVRRFWARDPTSRSRPALLQRLHAYLPRAVPSSGVSQQFFARGLEETSHPLYSHLLRFANTARCARLLDPAVIAAAQIDVRADLEQRLPRAFSTFTPLGRAQYLEIATFLTGYLLHAQGDRMLMGNSVEGRFPYLDHRVAEFAASLPDSYRVLGLTEKRVLRRAATGLVPDSIAARRKQPYRAPIARALAGPAAPEYVSALLSRGAMREAGIFDPDPVSRLILKAEQRGGTTLTETEEMALVGVVSTMLLHNQFVANPMPRRTVAPTKLVIADEPPASALASR